MSLAGAAADLLAPFAGSRLCVVGNVNRDLRLAPIEPRPQLFHDGETPTQSIRETLGGGGANSALAAAMLGARVSFAGKVGDDALGARLARTLAARNVEARLAVDPRVATGTSVNLVWDTGHRHFVSCLPNATSLTFDDVDLASMGGHRHLLRADVWFSEQMLLGGGNRKLLEAAKNAGLTVSLDVNADPWAAATDVGEMRQRRDALRDLMPLVDVVHGNVSELGVFTASHMLEDAFDHLVRRGAGAVVVHLGSKGAGFYQNGELVIEPPAPLDSAAVNTTGTGDVLSVCMMLLHDRADLDVRAKLRISNAVVAEYMTGRLNLAPDLVD